MEVILSSNYCNSNTDEPTRCNNDLSIYRISSTCFGQYFAHHQEHETDFYSIWYPVVVVGRETVSGSVALSATLPSTYPPQQQDTICCKYLSLTLLMMSKILPEKC